MIYDEAGSGGALGLGATLPTVLHLVVTAFGIGETLYNVAKARRGILEKVVVKSVRSTTSKKTLGMSRVLYVDTFNGLWNERDLMRPYEAHALVAAYRQTVLDDLTALTDC